MFNEITTRIIDCVPVDSPRTPENIELDIFNKRTAYRFPSRSRRRKKTSAAKWLINKRESVKQLRRYIKTYFSSGKDWYLTLTYTVNPESEIQVYRDAEHCIRNVTNRCRKQGIELFWLYIVEKGEKGRYHIHLLINRGVPYHFIENAWKRGAVRPGLVPTSAKRLEALSMYCMKQVRYESHKKGQHAWRSSKNIKEPRVEKDDRLITRSQFLSMTGPGQIDKDAVTGIMAEKFAGYVVVDMRLIINPYMDTPYLTVMLQTKEAFARAKMEDRRKELLDMQDYGLALSSFFGSIGDSDKSLLAEKMD